MTIEIPYKPKGEPIIEFIDFENAKFKTVSWKVPESVEYKGKIIYVHGFAEHSAIYTEFFDKLSSEGYEIFFFDQRGAGATSPGKKVGKTDEYHVFKDLDFMIKRNLDQRKDLEEKFFLVGHSMGGAIVLNYGIHGKFIEHIKGIIACAPLVRSHPNTEPNIVIRVLSPVINKLVPNLKIDSKINYDYITSNEGWKNYIKYHDGKLVGTVRQFNDMFARGELLTRKEYVSKFDTSTSVFLIHGTDDKISWIKGTEKFYSLLDKDVDNEFVRIVNAKHSLFIEREDIFKNIFEKVVDFLNNH